MGAAAVPLMVGGAVLQGVGAYDAGKAQQAAAEAEAGQLERNAPQLRAQGQLEGEEELRKSRLVQSRILAVAGASGAGVLDPSVLNIIGRNAAEGSLAAATRRYSRSSQAQDMEYQAKIKRIEGRAHRKAATFSAVGSLAMAGGMAAKK